MFWVVITSQSEDKLKWGFGIADVVILVEAQAVKKLTTARLADTSFPVGPAVVVVNNSIAQEDEQYDTLKKWLQTAKPVGCRTWIHFGGTASSSITSEDASQLFRNSPWHFLNSEYRWFSIQANSPSDQIVKQARDQIKQLASSSSQRPGQVDGIFALLEHAWEAFGRLQEMTVTEGLLNELLPLYIAFQQAINSSSAERDRDAALRAFHRLGEVRTLSEWLTPVLDQAGNFDRDGAREFCRRFRDVSKAFTGTLRAVYALDLPPAAGDKSR